MISRTSWFSGSKIHSCLLNKKRGKTVFVITWVLAMRPFPETVKLRLPKMECETAVGSNFGQFAMPMV